MPLVSGILGASGASRAGNAINDAAIAGEHGIANTLDSNASNVNTASASANNTLSSALSGLTSTYSPYIQGGQQAVNSLSSYAASNPQFSFQPTQAQLENTPGYQFQLQQGKDAINNTASAQGLANSGNTLAALTQYGQGLAGTYYQNAFNNALNTFQTNHNNTLENLSTLGALGLSGTNQLTGATQNLTLPQSQNTLNAALFNAGQGLQGSEAQANLASEGAQGRAAGILGSNNSLAKMFGGLGEGLYNAIPDNSVPGIGGTILDTLGSVFGL